eukprot:8749677-Pyramimonas_sp.AAC.1
MVVKNGMFNVDLIAHERVHLGPGLRLLRPREATQHDVEVLTALGREESRRAAEIYQMHQARHQAFWGYEGQPISSGRTVPGSGSTVAEFFKTFYKTRGKKARHEEHFPDL